MVKKCALFVALISFELILGFTYGFVLKQFVSAWICFLVAFFVPFVVLFYFSKNRQDVLVKLKRTFMLSLLLSAVSCGVIYYGNQLHAEFVGEYDVLVDYVNGRAGGCAYFIAPNGEEENVDLRDYRPIVSDDDCVEAGDTIRVREYIGVFGETYYVFVEEI